ncbi:restriction endonuclease subunit S [Shewanella sp. 4t3-1-2LB]|uniref:restriction endonuclease subunit S n=1 Tax=Shewanella sp. 4t3-1-2LB TaxID=2817682 RepID=UPI001A991D32|nr:restriction endonuclease subunit S [Shewanella sp. 4t3-1-2LB]MBO1270256.1 restriction endonuclease subunit S [Shewanella sp. 4t3-1-2LB]
MTSKWSEVSLADIYDIRSGLSKPATAFGTGFPFLSFKEVFSNYFVPDELEQLVESNEKERANGSIKRGDVFLTRTSETMHELGMSSVALKDYENATFNGFTKRLRPKDNTPYQVHPEFVGYFFRSPRFRTSMLAFSTLSTRASLNNDMINRLTLPLPPIDYQKKIARVLKCLDDKISVNTKTNQTLEAMAQAIFKSWFVDFDPVKAKMNGEQPQGMDEATASLFPEKLVESELGLIPEGWEVESLAELMDIKGGTQPPSKHFADELREGYVRLVQIRDYDTDNHLTYIPDEKKLRRTSPLDVMIGRYGAAVGRILWGLSGAYNVALVKAEPKRENVREFLRTYLLSNKFQAPMQMMSGRSAQSGFNKSDIASYKLALPSPEIFEAYENLALPIRRYGLSLKQQTRDLEVLRDTLLPKLLSGEIELSNSDDLAEVSA